jgi:hypothetical protein
MRQSPLVFGGNSPRPELYVTVIDCTYWNSYSFSDDGILEKRMVNDVFSFLWRVYPSGYEWAWARVGSFSGSPAEQADEGTPQWVLVKSPARGGEHDRLYSPLDTDSALFRTFAQLDWEDREAILAFANEYGMLLHQDRQVWLIPEDKPMPLTLGETWQDWAQQIDAMRRAVALWDMVEARDRDGLARHIRWQEAKLPDDDGAGRVEAGWVYSSHPEAPTGPSRRGKEALPSPRRFRRLIDPVLDLFSPGDIFTPASDLIQRWVNEHLDGQVNVRVVYDVKTSKRVPRIVPRNLLSAMWYQFLQAFTSSRKYRACKECGKWFEISTEATGFRINRLFCGDPCKSKDYRRRKEQARELKTAGKTVKEIAKELDTDVDTIKKWLRKRKG